MSEVRIEDIDDYITPSQACINPLFTSSKSTKGSNENKTPSSAINGLITNARRRRRKRTPLVISEPQAAQEKRGTGGIGGTGGGMQFVGTSRTKTDRESTRSNNVGAKPVLNKLDSSTNEIIMEEVPAIIGNKKAPPQISLSYDIEKDENSLVQNQQSKSLTSNNKSIKKATVSVADCLACSGCITSSEAVLITTQHSIDTLIKNCATLSPVSSSSSSSHPSRIQKKIVFTISPSSVADFIRILDPESSFISSISSSSLNNDQKMNKNDQESKIHVTYQKLTTYLHEHFNASIVLNGNIPKEISLLQSAIEFCARYQFLHSSKRHKQEGNNGCNTNLPNTTTCSNDDNKCKTKLSPNNFAKMTITKENKNNVTKIDSITTPSIALSATSTRFLINSNNNEAKIEGIEIQHKPGIDPRLNFLYPNNYDQINKCIDNLNYCHEEIDERRILPMLASSCPGFVCYVEKTIPNIISNLCTVKSPMAIAGSMFKHDLILDHQEGCEGVSTNDDHIVPNNNDHNIYHVAIMPCHDKKLEAGRKDLAWERFLAQEEKIVHDVDLVITTNELFSLLVKTAMEKAGHGNDSSAQSEIEFDEGCKMNVVKEYFSNLPLAPSKHWTNALCEDGVYISSLVKESDTEDANAMDMDIVETMRGSGSYAEFIFRYSCKALFDYHIPSHEPLPWKIVTRRGIAQAIRKSGSSKSETLMNRSLIGDHNEVTLYQNSDGTYSLSPVDPKNEAKAVLKFATAYGFKNIQLQMQRISDGRQEVQLHGNNYHYLETMACPSGCLNGGGQIKQDLLLDSTDLNSKRKEKPSEKRDRAMRVMRFVHTTLPCYSKRDHALEQIQDNKSSFLHTRFHVVPKLELNKGSTAGVSIDDTMW